MIKKILGLTGLSAFVVGSSVMGAVSPPLDPLVGADVGNWFYTIVNDIIAAIITVTTSFVGSVSVAIAMLIVFYMSYRFFKRRFSS